MFSGIILGDQSTDPDIDQIINWVDWAISQACGGFLWDGGDANLGGLGDIDIVGVVFTEPGDRSAIADALEDRFGNDDRFDRDTAIFVIWIAEDGTVWYDCIGPACETIPKETKEQITCELAGGCDNGVQEYNDTDAGGSQEGTQGPGGEGKQGQEGGAGSSNGITIGGPSYQTPTGTVAPQGIGS